MEFTVSAVNHEIHISGLDMNDIVLLYEKSLKKHKKRQKTTKFPVFPSENLKASILQISKDRKDPKAL